MAMSEKGEWSPGKKYQTLLRQIQDVLDNGEQRTVRDVYYALEARGNKWEYRYVKRAVKKGRRCGYIDPSQIVDSSRQPVNTVSDGWADPREFLDKQIRGIWKQYWENYWKYQDTYVELWLEKQSLATVFQPICREKVVRLEATRGDWSDSKVYEATQRLKRPIMDGKDVTILYFGDFNPSGYHAPVSILDAMEYYGLTFHREFPESDDPRYYDPEHGLPQQYYTDEPGDGNAGTLNFKRCAINLEHIERFDLPENPVPSSSDKDRTIKKWFHKYVSEGRDTNVELNALKEYERDFLEDLIREEIDAHVDGERKEQVQERIQQAREALSTAVQIDDSQVDDLFNPPIHPDGDGDE
jgi:hypothetical protein